ncbi:MAG: hypothetical protein ACRDL8_07830 [Solirubrobacteraceae bacterium]
MADALPGDLGDAIEQDPEVRQARAIADAARKRLVACVSGPRGDIDTVEARRMLNAFSAALAHADDAEDRVLQHRGLLTSVEADGRAARRRPLNVDNPSRSSQGNRTVRPAGPAGRRLVTRAACLALALVAAIIGVAFARGLGLRPPRAHW